MVGGSESEDSDESASSDDERAARLGCTKRTRSARARRFLCLALGQQAAVKGAAAISATIAKPCEVCFKMDNVGFGSVVAERFRVWPTTRLSLQGLQITFSF